MTSVIYRGQSDVALWCGGISRAAVSNWFARHDGDYPEPDAIIENEGSDQVTRGWLPARKPDWEKFAAARLSNPPTTARRVRKTADMIYQGVQEGRIDPAEAVRLLHELI